MIDKKTTAEVEEASLVTALRVVEPLFVETNRIAVVAKIGGRNDTDLRL